MHDHQNMVDEVFLIKKRNDKRVVVWHVNPIAWGSMKYRIIPVDVHWLDSGPKLGLSRRGGAAQPSV